MSFASLPCVLDQRTLRFYRHVMVTLNERGLPFLVGGAYAFRFHTGIARDTKDLDLFIAREDLDAVLAALGEDGLRSEVAFPHWLAKVYARDDFIDIIFNSGNGLAAVDADFFAHAPLGTCFGVPIRWCPAEEMIWTKAFVMERERFDGADIAHLLHAASGRIDWRRLLARFGAHWRLLLAHLVLFEFIYPHERDLIPRWALEELTSRLLRDASTSADPVPVCGGTLLSRQQFLVDVCEGGHLDARLTTGAMTESQVREWTAAIAPKR